MSTPRPLADWIADAWNRHADDPAAVAAAIDTEAAALAAGDDDLAALTRLAQHLHGTHLATPAEGRAQLARIAAWPAAGAATEAAVRVLDAALAITSGSALPAALAPSEQVRATATAAANLVGRDIGRAGTLFDEALALATTLALPDADPAVRALAVTGNNLACELEERPVRGDAERALMLKAASAARTHWARAGGWRETERAEYRLAHSWLKAGDAATARHHAQACLAIVAAHPADDGEPEPLEVFFGHEALALACEAQGDAAGRDAAVAAARAAFARLPADDQGWCRPSLERLQNPSAPTAA